MVAKEFDTCNIMGVNISVTNMDKTIEAIGDNLDDWRGRYICISNVHTTVTAYENPKYCVIQNNAVMSLPDGAPLSKYQKKQWFKTAARVAGPDLMQRILSESAKNGWKNYFYGSTKQTLDKLNKVIAKRYQGAIVCGMTSPPFRALTPDEDEKIIEKINQCKPDFVWVALGAPKQEMWMAAHEGKINALMIGVGAAFDYESGNIKRAPRWMQKYSLEWIYRLFQDPKRLFKRYFTTNIRFIWWKLFNSKKDSARDKRDEINKVIDGGGETGQSSSQKLKIAMFGQKHLSREGGVEVVATNQAVRFAALGHKVVCYNRRINSIYGNNNMYSIKKAHVYRDVIVRTVPTIRKKGAAAVTASFFASIKASFGDYDVVHIHCDGPSAFCWIPKLFGKKVICQNHGNDAYRPKWQGFGKSFLRFGEKMAARWSDELIVLNDSIAQYFKDKYGRDTVVIPNGINRPVIRKPNVIKNKWNLEKDGYILFVGRLTQEKGVHYLIDAYNNLKTNKKLVIAGIHSDSKDYKNKILDCAAGNLDIVFTGFVKGAELDELYSNCYIFVLPSDLEGMSMSLLEAMSYGNCCLVSDIPENICAIEDKAVIFQKGNVEDLCEKINYLCDNSQIVSKYKDESADYICKKYNWDDVVNKILQLYIQRKAGA